MASNKVGRPTVMTPDVKDLILEYLEAGYSNPEACAMMHIDPSVLYMTCSRDPEFNERYEAAKRASVDARIHKADILAEQATMAESGAKVAGLKVAIDHEWRKASRIAPQKWGEKATVTVNSQVSDDPQELAKRLAFLQALQGGDEPAGDDDEESLV
jgi:hypothetical protein